MEVPQRLPSGEENEVILTLRPSRIDIMPPTPRDVPIEPFATLFDLGSS
jgi:hypothetical protein